MAVFHIVLWNNALVGHPFLRKKIRGDRLLQESIPDVFLVLQDLLQRACKPHVISCCGFDPVCRQPLPIS